jgi:hypothetical protein
MEQVKMCAVRDWTIHACVYKRWTHRCLNNKKETRRNILKAICQAKQLSSYNPVGLPSQCVLLHSWIIRIHAPAAYPPPPPGEIVNCTHWIGGLRRRQGPYLHFDYHLKGRLWCDEGLKVLLIRLMKLYVMFCFHHKGIAVHHSRWKVLREKKSRKACDLGRNGITQSSKCIRLIPFLLSA